jgi:hypothetical protein
LRRNHDFWAAFVKLDPSRDGDRIASQGFQELLASYGGNVLRRDESCEDLLGISPAEVEESVALLGKAHLLNKTAYAGIFSDVVLALPARLVPPTARAVLKSLSFRLPDNRRLNVAHRF